ncbi:MAG: hypothetical protein PHU12_02030 [Candidatus Aenigmarchaeota archaeon]|nr:hypothetical protein [Candidatus Aenigmarchaeota archaeon]
MKGAVTILEAILIFAIAVSVTAVAVPWAYNALQRNLDISEMGTIRSQMELCNDKLIDTTRSGSSNKCIFSANRGKITAESDGIYYSLTSSGDICDAHSWAEVDTERHLESSCDASYALTKYNMRWRWPSSVTMEGKDFEGEILKREQTISSIEFDGDLNFRTITVVVAFEYTPGQAGKTVEFSRVALTKDNATLNVNIR